MLESIIEFMVSFYLEPNSYQAIIYTIIIVAILTAISISIYHIIQHKKRNREKLKKHLKNEQEEAIFNILTTKKGTCYQSTLAYVSKIPKSSLSETLDELEKRNIIKKIKKGNKNLISLKK